MSIKHGHLARQVGHELEVEVLKSSAGFYIGTVRNHMPFTRESSNYYKTEEEADYALKHNLFNQRQHA